MNIDQKDFLDFCYEFGFDPDIIKRISENTLDRIENHFAEARYFEILPSQIHGFGIFAKNKYSEQEYVGKARWNDKRTDLGRYTNHSKNPNSKMDTMTYYVDNKIIIDVCLFTKQKINIGEEITIDYRQVGRDIQGLTPCHS